MTTRGLIDAYLSGETAKAQDIFEEIIRKKIDAKISEIETRLPESKVDTADIMEALRNKLVVRNGKVRRKWTSQGGSQVTVRGKQYKARVAQVNPRTGRKVESNRSESQVRDRIVKMKRLWKSTMRSKLPQILRNRSRSMRVSKYMDL